MLTIVCRSRVHVANSIGVVLVMTAHRMFVRFSGRTDRRRQHLMVVRAAVDHGRSREPLKGEREQQKPRQCGSKTRIHDDSLVGTGKPGSMRPDAPTVKRGPPGVDPGQRLASINDREQSIVRFLANAVALHERCRLPP